MSHLETKEQELKELRVQFPDLGESGIEYLYFMHHKEEIQAENRKKEAELEADYNAMSDYYEDNPEWL
jgi:hypothetical protein